MHTLDFERITAEKLGGLAWVLDGCRGRLARRDRLDGRLAARRAACAASSPLRGLLSFRAADATRSRRARERSVGDGEARRRAPRPAPGARCGVELLGLDGLADAHPSAPLAGPDRRALPRGGRLDDLGRHRGGPAARDRAARARAAMSGPLDGVRVVEYAQYVAGPLCGVAARRSRRRRGQGRATGRGRLPPRAAGRAGVGRYFVPLNRGKRSVVVDLKTERGARDELAAARAAPTSSLHNFPPERATRFGLGWETLHAAHPALVVGRRDVVRRRRPARRRAGVRPRRTGALRPAHRARVAAATPCPVRAGGIPMADLTAGYLLASAVLAALVRARETGVGELVDVSLLAAALAVQVQDLVWLDGRDGRQRARSRRPRGPRGARGRDRGRRRDEPVLPLLRGVRRVRRRRLPQPRSSGGRSSRCSTSTTRRSRRRICSRRRGRARGEARADRGDRARDRDGSRSRRGSSGSRRGRAVRAGAAARGRRRRPAGARRTGSSDASTQPGLGEIDLLAPFVRVGGQARPTERGARRSAPTPTPSSRSSR